MLVADKKLQTLIEQVIRFGNYQIMAWLGTVGATVEEGGIPLPKPRSIAEGGLLILPLLLR